MRAFTLLFIIIVASACIVVELEKWRTLSPDGRAEAFVIERNGGATTSFGHEIFIGRPGASPFWATDVASFYGARRNQGCYGVNLRWESVDLLVVEFLEARNVTLEEEFVRVGGRKRRVLLRSGIDDGKCRASDA